MSKDVVYRQDAIDAVRASYDEILDFKSTGRTVADSVEDIISDLPSAQPEQIWIPCSERLPDVAQRVLLSGHGMVMIGMLHSFGKYSLEPTGISYAYSKDDIEAWMPLPEPYVRGEQNDSISD